MQGYANWLCLSNLAFEPELKECSGFLYKLKRTPTSFSTSWNKRFFMINTSKKTLEYFNKEPKEGTDTSLASDRRVIDLGQLVEVRVVDPWTFQLEVRDGYVSSSSPSSSPEEHDDNDNNNFNDNDNDTNANSNNKTGGTPPVSPTNRVSSVQLRAGGMNYFCLQAKTPDEQNEWRAIIENYVADLRKYRSIKNLEQRALDHRRSVTNNAMDVEMERVMMHTSMDEQI